jgi:hydrogenase expression/formation protein HypC
MCLAVPGSILSITDDGTMMRTGRVSFAGIVKEVNLAYVPEAKIGDYVMVHVGFAISVVDEAEARRVFEYLDQIDELQELRSPSHAEPVTQPVGSGQ